MYNFTFRVLSIINMPPKKGGKGNKSKKDLPSEPEVPNDSDRERVDEEDPDNETDADLRDEIVQFFEDRPYFYNIAPRQLW